MIPLYGVVGRQSNLVPKTTYLTEPLFKTRYLKLDGTQITQGEYEGTIASFAGAQVYRAAFIGVTYHVG